MPSFSSRTVPADSARASSASERTGSSQEHTQGYESPAHSSSADLPPATHARNRTRAETSRWKTIRPWRPPLQGESGSSSRDSAIDDDGALSLEVIDVSSTAIALGVFGLQSQSGEGSSTPAISIRLNSASWPHVFHSPASDDEENPNDRETVVVYGLEPGHEYNVELAVVGVGGSAGIPFTTPAASSSPDAASVEADVEEDAPPPYSPSPMPAQLETAAQIEDVPTESSLRAQIKKLRADAKAAEAALHGSISSLQRALERTVKDDQRTKQRLIQLDDGAKKLKEAAVRDQTDAEDLGRELPELERVASERQQDVFDRRAEVLQREKEVSEQIKLDEEVVASLSRQIEELRDRIEGVNQESDRYEREVIEDLTNRLAHLEHQLRSGEVSPSFLSGAPSSLQRPAAKTSSGFRFGRDRKNSNAAGKGAQNGKSTALAAPSSSHHRIIPGWKSPQDKQVNTTQPSPVPVLDTTAPLTPPLVSNPQHGPIAPPQSSPKEEKLEEKASSWRFGAIGESFARVTARSGK